MKSKDEKMIADRIRRPALLDKIVSAEEAAALIKDGMIIGMSGFTRAGDAKAVPIAMAARAHTEPFKITLITGASLGHDVDRMLTEAKVLARRMPFQADRTLRAAINRGEVMFIDQHLSETVEHLRSNQLGPIDYAIVEAAAITEEGNIVPSTSVGNSASFAVPCQEDHRRDQSQPAARAGRPARHLLPRQATDPRADPGRNLRQSRWVPIRAD
jgi:succinyl-CoA:acetate CoA-transferase